MLDESFAAIIFLCAALIIPIISFIFCFLFANDFNLNEAFLTSVLLDFYLLMGLNIAAFFIFYKLFLSIIIFILLFTGLHYWVKCSEDKYLISTI